MPARGPRSAPGSVSAVARSAGLVHFSTRHLGLTRRALSRHPLRGLGTPDFQKFDRALKTQVRPVLVSLQRLPFRDFTAEEFLGRTLTTCRGAGGCVSVFQGSSLTLGQMADACVYVGGGADVDSKAKPTR
jgi:hypothetical protein